MASKCFAISSFDQFLCLPFYSYGAKYGVPESQDEEEANGGTI